MIYSAANYGWTDDPATDMERYMASLERPEMTRETEIYGTLYLSEETGRSLRSLETEIEVAVNGVVTKATRVEDGIDVDFEGCFEGTGRNDEEICDNAEKKFLSRIKDLKFVEDSNYNVCVV